ncbi:MAG: MFS transporter [Armatimonadota bacterium]
MQSRPEGTARAEPASFLQQLRELNSPVLILTAISFVSSLGIAVMLPLIPLYAISLGASPWQLGLLTSAFALANAVSQLAAGLLIDRFGTRVFIRGGIATYAGANLLIATAATAPVLIAYRTLAGLGTGVNLVAGRIYLAQITDPMKMAFTNGVLSAAFSAGQVAGPAFGGIVTALADLRLPFLLVGLTSGIAFVGSLLLPRAGERTAAAPGTQASSAATGLFNRAAIILLVAQFCLLAGYGGFITTYAPLATMVLGWSTLEVGIIFSVFGAGSIVLGPWLSHLADRIGRPLVGALACLPIALFGIGLVLALPRPVLYAITLAAGGGLTAFTAAWFALLAEAAPSARRGRTFGVISAASNLGTVVGAMTASAIWQRANLSTAMLSVTVPVMLGGAAMLLLRARAPSSHSS